MPENYLIDLTADIVSAHVSNNNTATTDLPGLIRGVFAALTAAANPVAPETPRQEPAVSICSSIKRDYIVCLEDGVKLKMLKRYLRTNFDMSPEDYRAKWGLPKDYPMVAPAYAETRRALAQSIGLGRKKEDAPASKSKLSSAAGEKPLPGEASAIQKRGRSAKAKVAMSAETPVEASGEAPASAPETIET